MDRSYPGVRCIALRRLEAHDLVDVWRRVNGDKRQYTWTHARGNLISLAK